MKTLFATVLAMAPLAQAAAPLQPIDSVRARAEALAREHFSQPGQVVRVRATIDDRLQLPGCARALEARVQSVSGGAMTAAVSCTTPAIWTIYVVVQVSRDAEVLVLNRPLLAGETVTADAVSLHTRDIAGLGYGALDNVQAAVGQTARRALPAGAVLGTGDIVSPRLVKRGQPVTLVSRAGALVVRAEGKALADGAAGDYISVENLLSRRIVRGKVSSGQEVVIDL